MVSEVSAVGVNVPVQVLPLLIDIAASEPLAQVTSSLLANPATASEKTIVRVGVSPDFMAVSSYGSSTTSSGVVRIVKDLETDIEGRDVILVEDIVDSGLTLAYLRGVLGDRRPASLEICALLVREGAEDSGARYAGFPIPPDFVVGYGLDVAENYRELDAIRVFEPE